MENNTWCVYKHTSPSGKVYIGITHYEDPKYRFGRNGSYYKKGTVFRKAIDKYGWDNIKHEILYTNLSEQEAKEKEKELIKFYSDLGISYNMTIGGDGYNLGKNSGTPQYRTELSRIYRKKHPNLDKEQYLKHIDKKKKSARQYYIKNREKILEYKKSDTVREKARIRAAKWRKEHPNYMKEYMKKYNEQKKQLRNE